MLIKTSKKIRYQAKHGGIFFFDPSLGFGLNEGGKYIQFNFLFPFWFYFSIHIPKVFAIATYMGLMGNRLDFAKFLFCIGKREFRIVPKSLVFNKWKISSEKTYAWR